MKKWRVTDQDHRSSGRRHGTTNEIPIERFEQDERRVLKPPALHVYRSLVRPTPKTVSEANVTGLPSVERRALEQYAELVEAGS